MYFRLEVTVLPLLFFSSTWQHGRRKLLAQTAGRGSLDLK
jgi:hypothetical protein